MKQLLLFILMALPAASADPALTLYNQGFAVIRETIPLQWKAGISEVRYDGVTAHVEPESVILKIPVRILEQNYRNDPVSQNLLLSMFEGQTISFQSGNSIVQGKIIRSGYTPHIIAMRRYDGANAAAQYSAAAASTPVIEVDGRLVFNLPGTPLFPSLAHGTILKPALTWLVESKTEGKATAELSYVSSGMSWSADYNVVGNEKDNRVDFLGWVTMDNQTGRPFENARVQLMAGDVARQPRFAMDFVQAVDLSFRPAAPPVQSRTFDDYHLYTLDNRVTLRDRELKQVEFFRAAGVASTQLYIYDGVQIDQQYADYSYVNIRHDPSYGTRSNPKVWIMRELENTRDNKLGIPLPAGKVRFYKQDTDGRLQFVGENSITHTPAGERLRLLTGSAFDLVGERIRRDFRADSNARNADESFEIKLRNRKTTGAVTIRVVEHLYREQNWTIHDNTSPFTKRDSNTIEFDVTVPAGEEKLVTYRAHYTW